MAKAKSLADEIAELEPDKRLSWFDRLPNELQADLLIVRREFHAGKYKVSGRHLHAFLCHPKRGAKQLTCKRNAFQVWLSEGRNEQAQ